MKACLIAYVVVIVTFLVIDGLWLGLIARDFYTQRMGDLMRDPVWITPAAVFYLMYAMGLVILAVQPLNTDISLLKVAALGALVGMMGYGTYDMTNLATVRDWSTSMALVDWVWGTVLSSVCAVAGALAVRFSG